MNYNYFIDITSIFFIIYLVGGICHTIINSLLEWCNNNKGDIKNKLKNIWKIHPLMKKYFSFRKINKIEQYTNEIRNFNEMTSTISGSIKSLCTMVGLAPFILYSIIGIFPEESTTIHYLIFFCVQLFITTILSMPISYYEDFVIEQKYGFNNMNKMLFYLDCIKGTLFKLIITCVTLPLINYFLTSFGRYEITTILMFTGGLILLGMIFEFLYMTWFIKIFNKLEPLTDKKLSKRIKNLLSKYGYDSKMVYVMDASIRSNKSNAFIGGIGKSKKIVLFDTLLKNFSNDEIISILGHELAHGKLHHQLIKRVVSYSILFITMFISFKFIYNVELYHAFGFYWINNENIVQYSLIGYFLISKIINNVLWILDPLLSYISRKCEYAADKYSVLYTKNKKAMISALIKLSSENYSDILTNKYYEAYHYSHPSLVNRIKNLNIKKNKVDKKKSK